ncbi:MAG: heavy-metal-associated domain-containing protein [Deinococcus sp.]|nr:heavy-metal-associated domain-containing protein [Deinococcus sp.]
MTSLKIEGMSCGHCKITVEKALSQVAGVEKVEVFWRDGRAAVLGNAPVEHLIEAVQALGYPAQLEQQSA